MSTGIQHHIAPEVLATYKLTGEVQLSKKANLICSCSNNRCGTLYHAQSDAGHEDLWLGSKCVVQLNIRFKKGLVLATGVRLSEASDRAHGLATQLKYVKGHAKCAQESAERRAANALKEEAIRAKAATERALLPAEPEPARRRLPSIEGVSAVPGPRASISKLPGVCLPG